MSEKTIVPVNRHLLIELVENREEKPDHGILLPEDYAPKQSEHAVVNILDWAEEYYDQTIHLILENYVTCLVVEE